MPSSMWAPRAGWVYKVDQFESIIALRFAYEHQSPMRPRDACVVAFRRRNAIYFVHHCQPQSVTIERDHEINILDNKT